MFDFEFLFWSNFFIYLSVWLICRSIKDWVLFNYNEDELISKKSLKLYVFVFLGGYKILTHLSILVYLIFYLIK